MSILAPLLEGKGSLLIPGRGEVTAKKGVRFFATQNDANDATYSGRNKLPATLRARFLEAQVQDFLLEDVRQIYERRLERGGADLPPVAALMIAKVYSNLSKVRARPLTDEAWYSCC